MTALLVLALLQDHPSKQYVSLVSIDNELLTLSLWSCELDLRDPTARAVLVKKVPLVDSVDPYVQRHLVVDSSGSKLAVIGKDKGQSVITIWQNMLEVVRKVSSPLLSAIQWSPSSNAFSFQTRSGTIGIMNLSTRKATRSEVKGSNLFWSRDGGTLYVSKCTANILSRDSASWVSIDCSSGAQKACNTGDVKQSTWLSRAPQNVVDHLSAGFDPMVSWSRYGALFPYTIADPFSEDLTGDVWLCGPGSRVLWRRPISTSYKGIFWPKANGELWIAHTGRLFSQVEAPVGSIWVGVTNIATGARQQWAVSLPVDDLHEIAFMTTEKTGAVSGQPSHPVDKV